MKILAKVLAVVIVMAMALSLVPALEAPASAAATPILVLSSTTAVNPILDHKLSFEDFSTGGPHTVTFEWRAVGIKSNDAADPNAAHAFVGVTGTAYGQTSGDNTVTGKPDGIKGTTDWAKVTFTFGNVGVYGVSGTNYPGNILRFGMWKAKGELQIKNLQIKTGSTVKYDLNTDPTVAQAVTNTQNLGLTECALDELAAIDFEHCPWVAGQFSTGAYAGYLRFEGSAEPETTTMSKPTKPTTTKPTTTKPTTQPTTQKVDPPAVTTQPTTRPTTAPTTKKPTAPTTQKPPVGHNCNTQGHNYVDGYCTYCGISQPGYNRCEDKGHEYQNGFCVYCAEADPNYNPCANGHEFINGHCAVCGAVDPNATQAPTQVPTQAPTQAPAANTDSDSGFDATWLIVFVMVFAVGICVVVLYATGVFSKKK